eukprot:scaffold25843_cov24-Prasinocladus_malaysianus.AAC.1
MGLIISLRRQSYGPTIRMSPRAQLACYCFSFCYPGFSGLGTRLACSCPGQDRPSGGLYGHATSPWAGHPGAASALPTANPMAQPACATAGVAAGVSETVGSLADVQASEDFAHGPSQEPQP